MGLNVWDVCYHPLTNLFSTHILFRNVEVKWIKL
jgi:hypothetical protein